MCGGDATACVARITIMMRTALCYMHCTRIDRCGFNKRLGPINLMSDQEEYINTGGTREVASVGTELARIALQEVTQLIEAAEAKAFYCLAVNYSTLESLYQALLDKEVLSGTEVCVCVLRCLCVC